MNRTFHYKAGPLFALSAIMLIGAGGYFLWLKLPLAGAIALLLAIIHIERGIHSEYAIGDGTLTIREGRLSRDTAIPLEQIASANIVHRTRLLAMIPRHDIVVIVLRYRPRPIILTPSDAEQFTKALWKEQERHGKSTDTREGQEHGES